MYKRPEVGNLPIRLLDFRSADNLVKSCRTCHSESLHPDEDNAALTTSKHSSSPFEAGKQTGQYNHQLVAVVDSLRQELVLQTSRAQQLEKSLRAETQKSADLKTELERIRHDLRRSKDQATHFQEAARKNTDRLEAEVKKLILENEQLRRMSNISSKNPPVFRSDWNLALSDVRWKREHSLNDEEEVGTNFFEFSNFTETQNSKKEASLITTPSRNLMPLCHLEMASPFGSTNISYDQIKCSRGFEEENRGLKLRVLKLEESRVQLQKLLGELQNKQKSIQAQYQRKIDNLKIRIQVLELANGSKYY